MGQAMELVQNAILSGMGNDLGSGSNVDLCVITKGKTVFHRNIFKTQIPHKKDYRYQFKRGTTEILSTKKLILKMMIMTLKLGIPILNRLDIHCIFLNLII